MGVPLHIIINVGQVQVRQPVGVVDLLHLDYMPARKVLTNQYWLWTIVRSHFQHQL